MVRSVRIEAGLVPQGAEYPGPGARNPVLIVFLVLGPGTWVFWTCTFVWGRAGTQYTVTWVFFSCTEAGYPGILSYLGTGWGRLQDPGIRPQRTRPTYIDKSDFSEHLPLTHTLLREILTRMERRGGNNLQHLIQSIPYCGKKFEYNSILIILN